MWKPVRDYEGLYEASDNGKIKSLRNNIVLKPQENRDGYLLVTLCKDNVKKGHSVHRLVAKAFIDNPNNYPEVNHIDEDKKNNCVANLEWCTHKHNVAHGTATARRSKKLSKRVMISFPKTGEELICVSQVSVCDILGCSKGHIWKALTKGYSIYGWKAVNYDKE